MLSEKLKQTILRELKLDEFDFTEDTIASDLPGWDSLNHINVILAIEKEFNIRFRNVEILRLRNIEELQKLIDSKTQA